MASVLDIRPNVGWFKPGRGDGVLRGTKIRSTPSSRMRSKAGRSHVVRFYGILKKFLARMNKIIGCKALLNLACGIVKGVS
jgi:hypothetical protein